MGDIGKRLTAPATLILLALVLSVILLPVAASAHHKDGHDTGKAQPSTTTSTPITITATAAPTATPAPTAPPSGDHDGDADLNPATALEDSHEAEVGVDDNRHPSGKDRSAEHGGSGNQGKSESAPDDNVGPMRNECGASPALDPRGGCTDKPGGSGGIDLYDQDGNNGCGNDDDFDDDNNGHCGGKVKPTPTPTPSYPPTTPPPTTPPPETPDVVVPSFQPFVRGVTQDNPGVIPFVESKRIVVTPTPTPPICCQPRPPLPVTGASETALAFVMFGFALLLLGGGTLQFVSVRPTL